MRSRNAASSRTLLIYLYPPVKLLGYEQLNSVVQEVSLLSHPKHLPKLLLICHSEVRTLSPLQQLRYLWHLRFFNAVVLEVSFPPRQSQPVLMAAHLYNGFNKRYTRLTSYNDNVDWYPDKSRNMQGAKLQVTFEAPAPYGTLEPGSSTPGGLAGAFADAMMVAVNATVVAAHSPGESDLVYNAVLLLHTDGYSTSYEHTVNVDHDRVCLLLPVLARERISMNSREIILATVIGVLITTILWSTLMTLMAGDKMSQPMVIISQILCIPPANEASTTVEKIMFVAIMLSTAEYANVFHAELFRFTIRHTDRMPVSNFEDLYETGMTILIPPMIHETIETIRPLKKLPPAFLHRFQPSGELDEDKRTMDTSKAYLMSEMKGEMVELTRLDGAGRRLFRLYDLCVIHLYRVHELPVRSPYRDQVNRVLLIMTEHGLTKKHLDDFWYWLGSQRIRGKGLVKVTIRDFSKYVGITAVFTGCLSSLVVFVGELIVALLAACRHSPNARIVVTDSPEVDPDDPDDRKFRRQRISRNDVRERQPLPVLNVS